VMGNPPYSGISQNNGEWIARLMEDYKVEPGGKQRLQERKNWLNDDYVKFIRLAEHYVEKNGEGIVAYITPHGFLDNPTFRGMRWHLMQTFDEMWTLNLHGNSKKKEVAPDGGKDECVFDITQGVAITMMVKRGKTAATASVKATAVKENAKDAKIYYADLWGRKKDKLAALEGLTMESVEWQEVNPTEPMLFFVPRDTIAETEYSKGFKIEDLFLCNVMGIVTARDAFVVDIRKEDLLSRVYDFCSLSQADDVIRARYFGTKKSGKYLPGDTRGWKLGVARKKIASYNHEQVIKPVNYRPFDPRFIYYSPDMVDWGRERLMSHFLKGNNFGLCCIRICSRDDDLPVFVTDKITDKTILSSKDNANVFPLYLYEENMGKVEKRANLDKDIVAKIAAIINPVNPVNPVKETPSPEDIFDYIYGVLHSPDYRAKFKEFLKVDFPRIPYPKDAAEFERFRDAGLKLRMTHLMRDAEPTLSETRARFPVAGNNVVDAVRWELPCDNHTPPTLRATSPVSGEELHKDSPSKIEGVPEGRGSMISTGRVYINATQYFDNVPVEAWEQAIGGYRPAEKWLKDRKGRKLTPDEIKHYQRIILALDKTSEIMNGLKE